MKKLSLVLCLLLIACMVLGACGKKADNSTASESSVKEEASSEAPAEEKEEAPAEESPAEEAPAEEGDVTFDENGVSPEHVFPIVDGGMTLKVMVPNTTQVSDFSTNDFTIWYEDLTGIHVDWNVIPQDSLTDKVNISLSSGDMPDVYMQCGITQTQQMVYGSMGAFVPMNDYIDKYSTMFQDIESLVPGLKDIITLPDGNIYCLPYIEKCVHCENSSKMWMNTDFLKNVGMEAPTTVEEFENVLKAFKEQDANGNGNADDEIPLISFEGGWHSNALSGWLTDPFVYTAPDNDYVYLENGKIQLSYMQDGWKDAMKWLHSLYEQGLYYDQSLIINNDQARTVATNEAGDNLVGCFPNGVPSAVPGDALEQWGPYTAISPIEGPAGRYATFMPFSQITPTCFIITSTCANPAAAFRWGVEQYDREINIKKVFGNEGTQYIRITPGEGDVPADAVDLNTGDPSELAMFADGVMWGDEQNVVWRANGPRIDPPDAKAYRYNQYQIGTYEDNMEYRLSYDTRNNYQPYDPDPAQCLPPLVFDDAQSAELANSQTVVKSYVEEMAARFISGDLDVESNWDSYLKELDVKGVQGMIDIYQAAYDAKN